MDAKNYVIICNKINSLLLKEMKQMEVQNLSSTVEELAGRIAQLWDIDRNDFDVVCFGKLLDYSKTLDFYGIENGTILYLLKRKQIAKQLPSVTASKILTDNSTETPGLFNLSAGDQGMCIALKSALLNSSFRQVIENLSDFDNRENLITVNNELRNDPSLFGVLSDSELLHAYINKNNIKNVLKRYPYFLEVATHVSATFHEEINSSNSINNLGYRGSLLNYSIDAISEDEEMDESETSSISSTNTNGSMRRLSDPSTSFSSMLMQAYHNQNRQNQSTSAIITQDMLRQALQSTSSSSNSLNTSGVSSQSQCETFPTMSERSNQELSDTVTISRNSSSNTRSNTPQPQPQPQPAAVPTQSEHRTTAQILIGWAPQLRQMRELGITDDIVAIQALEATNGDVQAAINIIFSDMA